MTLDPDTIAAHLRTVRTLRDSAIMRRDAEMDGVARLDEWIADLLADPSEPNTSAERVEIPSANFALCGGCGAPMRDPYALCPCGHMTRAARTSPDPSVTFTVGHSIEIPSATEPSAPTSDLVKRLRGKAVYLAREIWRQDPRAIDLSDNGDFTNVRIFRPLDLVEFAREIVAPARDAFIEALKRQGINGPQPDGAEASRSWQDAMLAFDAALHTHQRATSDLIDGNTPDGSANENTLTGTVPQKETTT